MNLSFFTEMGFSGTIPRNHNNMRTEFAWMCALNGHHYNINHIPEKRYDLGIIIMSKKNPKFDLDRIKSYCDKVAIMQEGPHWYWQDYTLDIQTWYYNTLCSVDMILVHNKLDKDYYEGLTNHPNIKVLPSLMIEDSVSNMEDTNKNGVIIGGNFVNWYNGFDSFIVAREFGFDKIIAPSMGRKQPGEDQLLYHLPYLNWVDWIKTLKNFKYAVHLMRTHAAGTFALNCAYLGIPCIGYKGLDTQQTCHPNLTVEIGDLKTAKEIVNKLKDESFYQKQSEIAKENYKKYYSEEVFLKNMNGILC